MFIARCPLIVFVVLVVSSSAHDKFVPSREWQNVQPGQPIPAGMHVKFDLKTGRTQAKIMADKESESYDVVLLGDSKRMDEKSAKEYQSNFHKMSVVLDTFRPYSELREDYKKMAEMFKSESTVLDKLFCDFEKSNNDDESVLILEEMEDLLRKYDNAVDFTKNLKLNELVDHLQKASAVVKVGVLSCLAAALQSNLPVKTAMYRVGLLDKLVQLWHQELLSPKIDLSVIGQCLLATSAFIRNFPRAQKKFFGSDGFNLLKRTLEFASENAKITLRVFSLLGELLEEHNFTGVVHGSEKSSQYELVWLAEDLSNYGFCQAALEHLFDPSIAKVNSYRQRMMRSVLSIANVCSQQQLYPYNEKVHRKQIKEHLDQWRQEFAPENKKEPKDESDSDLGYDAEVLHILNDLQRLLCPSV